MYKKHIKVPYGFKINEQYCFFDYMENDLYYNNVVQEYKRIKSDIMNYALESFKNEGSEINLFIEENKLDKEIKVIDIFIVNDSKLISDLFNFDK